MEFSALISVAKDVCIGGSAVCAAIIGSLGVNAWKRQLRGNTEYDLARRFLHSAYKMRDAIQSARTSWTFREEEVEALKAAGIPNEQVPDVLSDRKHTAGLLYQRRWEKIVAAKSELDLVHLECEVIWGTLLAEPMRLVKQTMHELLEGIEEHIAAIDRPKERYLSPAEIRARIYSMGNENDKLLAGIRIWTFKFESAMRPHLRS